MFVDARLSERLVLRGTDTYGLTGGSIGLVPITIGFFLSGDVLDNPHLGQALAFGMFVVLGAMMLAYLPLQRVSSRWVK